MADRNLRIRMLLEAADKVTRPLRDIAAGSSKTAKALKATRDRLKEIERAQAEVAGFRQLKAGLQSTDRDLQTAQQRVNMLARKMKEAETPTRELAREFAKAKREAQTLTQQHDDESRALQKLRDKLNAAGVATRDLARHERDLRQQAKDTSADIDRQASRLAARSARAGRFKAAREGFDSTISKASNSAGAGLGAIGAAAAIATPIKAVTQDAMDFQSVMADVKKVVNFDPGAKGAAQFDALGQSILKMSETIPVSAEGLGQIVAAAGRSGIARQQLAGFAEDAAKMSVAFDISADDAGTMAATWRTAFNTDRAGVIKLGDQVNALTNAFGGNVVAVNEMVTRIGPLGHVAGTSSGEIAGMAQMMAKLGLESDVGATGIKSVLLTLTRGAATVPKARKAFKQLGLDATSVAKRMQKDAGGTIIDVFHRISKLAAYKQPAVLTQLFGKESIAAIAPLLTNLAQLRTNFKMVGDASQYAGSMQKEYISRLGTTQNDVQLAQNNFKELGIVVGTGLLPTVTKLARSLSHGLQQLTAFSKAHPAAITMAAKLAATLAVLMAAGGVFLFLRAGVLAAIAPFKLAFGLIASEAEGGGFALTRFGRFAWSGIRMLPKLAAGAWSFAASLARAGVMLLANPMTLTILAIVAAVALLAGAGYLIYRNWGAISAFFSRLWGEITADFSGGIGGLARLLTDFSPLGLLYRGFAALVNWLGGSMPARLSDVGANLIRGLINGITGMLGSLKSTVVNAASSAANWFKQKLGIHSPSRVFLGFGGFMMQGLANGIDDGAGAPVQRIDRLSRRLSDGMRGATAPQQRLGRLSARVGAAMALGAAMPAVAATGGPMGVHRVGQGAPAAAPTPIAIHIHPKAEHSPQDIARAVEAALDRREREKLAAKRSAFNDQQDWD